MLEEFKTFIMRGNVLDMAVGVIIGAAFGKISSSLVSDMLMPPLGLVLGQVDFSDLFFTIKGGSFKTLAAAQTAGAVTINYGMFLNTLVNFLIVAFAIFMLIKQVNRFMPKPAPAPEPVPTRECPMCMSVISPKARRCPHCTSPLSA